MRTALLTYIGANRKLHALAAEGEQMARQVFDEPDWGSADFYRSVLEYVKTAGGRIG